MIKCHMFFIHYNEDVVYTQLIYFIQDYFLGRKLVGGSRGFGNVHR